MSKSLRIIYMGTPEFAVPALELLIKNQGSKQVLMGLDDPYPLGEMESVPQSSYPGKILDLAQNQGLLDQDQYDAIWSDNVLQWLFGDDQQQKDALIKKIIG